MYLFSIKEGIMIIHLLVDGSGKGGGGGSCVGTARVSLWF